MPPLVTQIENDIDRVAATRSWVSGDEHTMEHLRAVKWRFRTRQAGAALQHMLSDCNTTLAREFVLAGAPVDVTAGGWFQLPAIDAAASCDEVDLVRLLIARGALQRRRQARSFLERSAVAGYPQMVAIALQHYADANIEDREGVPLISRAAAAFEPGDAKNPDFDSARVVEMLLRAGANPNARDEDSNTPLFEANRAAVARVLIARRADPSARNKQGKTPLFADGIEVLIHAGADVNAKDTNGNTAVEQVPTEKAVLTLLDAGAQLPSDPMRMKALVEKARKNHWDKALARLESAQPPLL